MTTHSFGYLTRRIGGAEFCRRQATALFAQAGVGVNGREPWDFQVHDERFFARVLGDGSLGLGESYMDGWWDCDALDECICRLIRARLHERVPGFGAFLTVARAKLFNLQNPRRAEAVGRRHYDIDPLLYERMLDRRMIYSCGYWRDAQDLDAAQEAKLDLVCRKLGLGPGMRVLDIGCGWGGAALFAAERYGVEVVGVTNSRSQAELAAERCRGWPVEIRLQDYREVEGRFDRIFSIGMFEHVGVKNYRAYIDTSARLLRSDGLFLLHTIGENLSYFEGDRWLVRYIFPNSMLPSPQQIARALEGRFVLEDWHSFGQDYVHTLKAWHQRFEAAWPELRERFDERFYRMWRYYLLSCAGAFKARHMQLWQLVLSPRGVAGGYIAPR